MVTEKYQPDAGMLDLFKQTLGNRGLDHHQQNELLAMCEGEGEAKDLFYFIFIERKTALTEVIFPIRAAVGMAFIFRCNRIRDAMRLDEETRKIVFRSAPEFARAV